MIRSLYTGINGMRNHQLKMDVTSHNIANVNTQAYKSQRVVLKEGFTQMLRGATRPAGNAGAGGTNPLQIGLGMSVGSIDNIMDQGALQTTGQITDLSIEGRGFFAFSNGRGGRFYGRNGALQLNANGYLVSGSNGWFLQGLTADVEGKIPHNATIGAIQIPWGEKAPPKATQNIEYVCNLDADGGGRGTWVNTQAWLKYGVGNDLLTGLYDENGNSFNIQEMDILSVTFKDSGGVEHIVDFSVRSENLTGDPLIVHDLDSLAGAIKYALNSNGEPAEVAVGGDGRIYINDVTGTPTNLFVNNTTRPTSDGYVSNAFQWIGPLTGSTPTGIPAHGKTLGAVTEATELKDILDSRGRALNLENGDPIKISGTIGDLPLGADTGLIYSDGEPGSPGPATTMKMLMDHIQTMLRLPDEVPNTDGSKIPSIEINTAAAGDTRAPVGSLIIRGQLGDAFAISGLGIIAGNSNNNQINPSNFNANAIDTPIQHARDTLVRSTAIEVFDESGSAHTVVMTFTHSGKPGEWLWELSTKDGEWIVSGNRGKVTFSEDGSPASWIFDDDTTSFIFNPRNGSANVDLRLRVGENGLFTGITQFQSPTTTAASHQDGYPMGKLSELSISEDGEISGIYTNGVSKMIAKVLLAEFNNPAGLLRIGDSMWAESNNSGEGTLFAPGEGTSSTLKPGAIEMSNVDLATEFTDLITTQRGYQANARVISTSDQLLQELVQLVR